MVAELLGVDGIIVVVVVALVLLFGGSRIPKLARSLGSASHEYKKGIEEGDPDGTPSPEAARQPFEASDQRVDHGADAERLTDS